MTSTASALLRAFAFAAALILTGCFSGIATNGTPIVVEGVDAPSAMPTVAMQGPTPGVLVPSLPPHPLSIEMLRRRPYAGSDLVIEEVLAPGDNYNRYVVSYDSDGLKIYALLTVPLAEKPPTGFPVVVFNHGYIPPTEYRTTERYVAYVDAFARNEYIVIKPDYRGHGASEGDAEPGYGSPGYVIDVLNALASVRRHPDADPDRVGMWGHSMGGYIALRAMVANQGIKAGVIWAGVVASYEEMFQSWFVSGPNPRSGWRSDMIQQYGTPQQNPAFWDSLSANSYLADLTGPIQLHHGTGDTSVPYMYSTMLDEQIRAAGRSTELLLYPGDDHNISANRDTALAISLVFFNQHVKGLYG